jgi:hypothetical protein
MSLHCCCPYFFFIYLFFFYCLFPSSTHVAKACHSCLTTPIFSFLFFNRRSMSSMSCLLFPFSFMLLFSLLFYFLFAGAFVFFTIFFSLAGPFNFHCNSSILFCFFFFFFFYLFSLFNLTKATIVLCATLLYSFILLPLCFSYFH